MKNLFLSIAMGLFAITFANPHQVQAAGKVSQQTITEAPVSKAASRYTFKFRVVDRSGLPIIGANIICKGFWSDVGTITDVNGNAILTVNSPKQTFVISYIGYKQIEITVSGTFNIIVTMEEDNQVLDQIQ